MCDHVSTTDHTASIVSQLSSSCCFLHLKHQVTIKRSLQKKRQTKIWTQNLKGKSRPTINPKVGWTTSNLGGLKKQKHCCKNNLGKHRLDFKRRHKSLWTSEMIHRAFIRVIDINITHLSDVTQIFIGGEEHLIIFRLVCTGFKEIRYLLKGF